MSVDISRLAYEFQKASEVNGFPPVKRSHALELVAAALGYDSLAAYKAAIAAGDELADLSEVAHLVPQLQRMVSRAGVLRPRAPGLTYLDWLNRAIGRCWPNATVYLNDEALFNVLVARVEHATENDPAVLGQLSWSNGSRVDEVYMPFDLELDEIVAVGKPHVINIAGHASIEFAVGNTPAGREISVRATLELRRLGQVMLAEPVFQIESAKLIYGNPDPDGDDELPGPPQVSYAQALADELGLSLEEAEQLVDVEAMELTGSSGDMTYGFQLDFSGLAPMPLRNKLELRGQLVIQVAPAFFERVAPSV